MLFSALLNAQDDVQDGSNNRVENYRGFAMIDYTEKISLLFFEMVMC